MGRVGDELHAVWADDAEAALRRMRVLGLVTVLGSLSFLGLVAALILTGVLQPGGLLGASMPGGAVTTVAVGGMIGLAFGSSVAMSVRRRLMERAIESGDASAIPTAFANGSFIVLAVFEGWALFGGVLCLLTGALVPWGPIGLMGTVMQVWCFPRRSMLAPGAP